MVGAELPTGWQIGAWALVGLAAVAAAGGAVFYSAAARAPAPGEDARHGAEVLASRSTVLYDLGMAAGAGLVVAEVVAGAPGALFLAAGLALIFLSVSGRLLILGARRRAG
jgi:hypothetical protein